ncbi:MAG: hypothetical protein JWN84_1310 [Nocardioides sp.]|nr:hypothetical protein [Nocardioides sp.]
MRAVTDSSSPGRRDLVLLATCTALPHGEDERADGPLVQALAERGIEGRWVAWDDAAVDWGEGLVAVRSTWDYETRLPEFLAWARSVPTMLNSAELFAWNTDKHYLVELAAAGVPVVPTVVVEADGDLARAVADHLPAVVKPTVSAGGRGVVVVTEPGPVEGATEGPWVVQPLVDSVRTEGETSVFVLDGVPVSQARKVPAGGEIRVHEVYGGSSVGVPLTPEASDLARTAVAAAEERLGRRIDYARVDQMRLPDGTLALSELEATEPGLYLEVLPGNAAAFADLVAARLRA